MPSNHNFRVRRLSSLRYLFRDSKLLRPINGYQHTLLRFHLAEFVNNNVSCFAKLHIKKIGHVPILATSRYAFESNLQWSSLTPVGILDQDNLNPKSILV